MSKKAQHNLIAQEHSQFHKEHLNLDKGHASKQI